MKPQTFQWCAFDPNRWDHYYAAGQQMRFCRTDPARMGGHGVHETKPRTLLEALRQIIERARA